MKKNLSNLYKKKQNLTPQEIAKKEQERKKIIKYVLIGLACVVVVASLYVGFGVFKQIEGFSKEKLLSNESSVCVSEDGTEWYSYGAGGVRKNVSYEEIPQVMIDAVVAAEDSRFFEHNGFDLPRIVKAFMGNLVAGRITGGGSTITQQVIKKSYYPKEERTIERKVGEVILSIEATSQTTKEEILELYLNKIYFGYGNKAIGIYAASQYYFDKSVQELTLPEAALLAGTLNSPNKYDPFKNLDLAQQRRDTILKLMLTHGYISEDEYEATKAIPVENTLKSNPLSAGGNYQAYADRVTREVYEKTGYDPNDTAMRITTCIDTGLQSELDDIASGKKYKFMDKYIDVGAVVQESTTGRIIGVISGREYTPMGTTNAYAAAKSSQTNYGQRHQPGSSLKPIIAYGAAFEFLNYSTAHYVHDVPYSYGNGTIPTNWNGTYNGDISIKDALLNSWNLSAIQTYNEVITGTDLYGNDVGNGIGSQKMIEYLEGFGFDMDNEEIGPQYAIGGWAIGVSPEEEAGAYAAVSNGGTYIEPHSVIKIEIISTGEVINLEEDIYFKEKKQAISEESAYMIRDVMTSYVKESRSGSYARFNLGYQIGAKSGTSNYSNDVNAIPNKKLAGKSKDAWLTAFSPDYSWSVWTGYSSANAKKGYYPSSNRDSYGVAALIAKYIHKGGVKNSYPSQPSGIVKASCISGIYPYVKPGSDVPSNRIATGWFKKDNVPSETASAKTLNQLTSFAVSTNESGKIAVEFAAYDPKSMTESSTPKKTYVVEGKSFTLPYYGDISQIYGKVVYVAEVRNAAGTVVHTEKLSQNSAVLNFTPTSGEYTVTGYYAFESGSSTSNKREEKVTVTVNGASSSYSASPLNATQLSISASIAQGSKITYTMTSSTGATLKSGEFTTSGSYTIDFGDTKGTVTISFVETKSDGTTYSLPNYNYTIQ